MKKLPVMFLVLDASFAAMAARVVVASHFMNVIVR